MSRELRILVAGFLAAILGYTLVTSIIQNTIMDKRVSNLQYAVRYLERRQYEDYQAFKAVSAIQDNQTAQLSGSAITSLHLNAPRNGTAALTISGNHSADFGGTQLAITDYQDAWEAWFKGGSLYLLQKNGWPGGALCITKSFTGPEQCLTYDRLRKLIQMEGG